jgi:signal transduction histidine kinase
MDQQPHERRHAATGAGPPGGGPRTGAATSVAELERRLAQTQKVAALGALVARLAHEIGTPLHSMGGHLDLLMADPDVGTVARRRVEILSGEVDRLSKLIRRYLVRLQPPGPERRPTDLAALCRRVADLLEPSLAPRGIEIGVDVVGAGPQPVACDPDQIEQVLLNLVQNAVDAMPRGGLVTIRVDGTADGRTISVADSGRGVPKRLRDHVFEPFFTTKPPGKGSGLGLAICREVARAHGGDLRMDSKEGVGTTVTLSVTAPVAGSAS